MDWDKDKFYSFILDNNIIGIFDKPFTLKSGRKSYWYVNWRNIAEDVYLFDKLTDFLISYIVHLGLNPDCFYGVPEGATKLGIITQFKWALSDNNIKPGMYILTMGRGKVKSHGDPKDRLFLGIPKGNVIILEDTITTGSSLLKTIDFLLELKINIIAIVSLTDRNELRDDGMPVKDVIKSKNISYYAMSNALDLLPKLNPDSNTKNHIIKYFEKYGEKPILF
jgi:orotate phosphoribosyltransferase